MTSRTLQGMARVRSGQAPAWPLVSDRSVRRGSGVKRDFACAFTRHFSPVLVALRSQSRLRLEGRIRTLSGPSPELSSATACTSPATSPWPRWSDTARLPPFPRASGSADALNAALPRKARAAQAGRGLQHWGRPEPLGRGGSRGRQPSGKGRPSRPALTPTTIMWGWSVHGSGGFGEDARTLHPHAGGRKESPCGLHAISTAIPPAWRRLLLRNASASKLPRLKWLVSPCGSDWELAATRLADARSW
jgi:hypothetical protein